MEEVQTFRSFAAVIFSPPSDSSSNQQLKTATAWIESQRKAPNSFDYFYHLLQCQDQNFNDYEYLLASQSLLWICKRCNLVNSRWISDLLLLLQDMTCFTRPVKSNIFSSIAVVILRSSQFPSQQTLSDLYSLRHWDLETFLLVLLRIPEFCHVTDIYHGTKEQISEHLILCSTSLFHEISFINSFLDMLLNQSSTIDDIIVQFITTTSEQTQLFYIFSLITQWLNISKHLEIEYNVVITCQCADLILSSQWFHLLERSFQYLSQQGMIFTDKQNDLLQLSSEVMFSLLQVNWAPEYNLKFFSMVLQTYSLLLQVISEPFSNMLLSLSQDSSLITSYFQSFQLIATNSNSSSIHTVITTLISESFINSCQQYLSFNSLHGQQLKSEWSLFLQIILQIGNNFQEIVKITWPYLRLNSVDLHNAHYSSRIMSLHIWRDLLSFWDQIFNFNSSFRLDLSLFVEEEIIQRTLIGVINECSLVENPSFLIMKYCDIPYGHCEGLILWTEEEEDNHVFFRKNSRDFLRNFCINSTTKKVNHHVLEWIFDQTIRAIHVFIDSNSDNDYHHTAITESLLHSVSSLSSGDSLQHDSEKSLQEKSYHLVAVLFQYHQIYSIQINPPSHFRFILRIGVLLVNDLYPIILKVLPFPSPSLSSSESPNLKLNWTRNTFFFLLDSLRQNETISFSSLSSLELHSISTSLPFRIKQDHIGVVSLLKFIRQLKKEIFTSLDYSCLLEMPTNILSQVHIRPTTIAETLLHHFLQIFVSFALNENSRMTFKSYLILVEVVIEYSCVPPVVDQEDIALRNAYFLIPVIVLGFNSLNSKYTLSRIAEGTRHITPLEHPQALEFTTYSFDKRYDRVMLIKLMSSYLQYTTKLLFIKTTPQATASLLVSIIQLIHSIFFPFCDIFLDEDILSNEDFQELLDLHASCIFQSPTLDPTSYLSHVPELSLYHHSFYFDQVLTRIISFKQSLRTESQCCIWIAALHQVLKSLISWNNILISTSIIEKLFIFLTTLGLEIVGWNSETHSFSNLLPISFYITLFGIWSKSLDLINRDISLTSRLMMIYFADFTTHSLFSNSNIEDLKSISQYFKQVLCLYSAILGHLETIHFISDRHNSDHSLKPLDDDGFPTNQILKLIHCHHEPCGHPQIIEYLEESGASRLLLSSLLQYLRQTMISKFTETHKDLLFHLFIKYFLIFGTTITSSHLHLLMKDHGGVNISNTEQHTGDTNAHTLSGTSANLGLDGHLASHALSGNWKKFKNCLKSFMK